MGIFFLQAFSIKFFPRFNCATRLVSFRGTRYSDFRFGYSERKVTRLDYTAPRNISREKLTPESKIICNNII